MVSGEIAWGRGLRVATEMSAAYFVTVRQSVRDLTHVGWLRSIDTGFSAFERAEFSPNWQMVRNL